MNILVFDIDNTIILHTKNENDFYNKKSESRISELISQINHEKAYVFTNGLYRHGYGVVKNLYLSDNITKIFARDTIPSMKPSKKSFQYVNNEIIKDTKTSDIQIYFFDDLIENLEAAHNIGWKTIWISPYYIDKKGFIDYSFPNIYEALILLSPLH
mgnify:FL=1|tara:strand:+ start:250 stop:720 length:471 start_codon:yes stop_codon:yes gene_type:complete